jgi:glycosyltransferase involved in cell wall biosynthesis
MLPPTSVEICRRDSLSSPTVQTLAARPTAPAFPNDCFSRLAYVTTSRIPVTVVIPCFNDGSTVDASIQSALDSGPSEVIVVDDGSTDVATRDRLEEHRRRGVTVVRIDNSGPAAARTSALEHVSTPFLFNLDADDELLPGALSRLYEVMSHHPSLDVVWGDYRMFGERAYTLQTSDYIDGWLLTFVNDLPVSALFRTETLRAVGGWRTGGYEDWDLWMSLAERGASGWRVPIPVFRYRTRPASAMRGRARDESRHDVVFASLRARHASLFEHRRRAWLRSGAPWLVRITLPLAAALPVSGRRRIVLLWRAHRISQRFARRSRQDGAFHLAPRPSLLT